MSVYAIARAHQFLNRLELLLASLSRALELRARIVIGGLPNLLLEAPDLGLHRLGIDGAQVPAEILATVDQPRGPILQLGKRSKAQGEIAITLIGVSTHHLA